MGVAGCCGYKNITLVSIDTFFTKQNIQVEFRLFSDGRNVSKHAPGLQIFFCASLVRAHIPVKHRHILKLYLAHTAMIHYGMLIGDKYRVEPFICPESLMVLGW